MERSPLVARAGAPGRQRSALPRPLLARGGAGLRRPARPSRPPPRRRSTRRPSTPGCCGSSRTPATTSSATAARAAAERWTTVLTGGPGTGKTTTVAGLLALLAEQARAGERRGPPAPDRADRPDRQGAARLQESVDAETRALPAPDQARLGELTASTLHRLLGWRPDSSTRFRHDRGNRLPHDVVVVDETSMVSLTMMARLLEAVRPDARLVLVGDPDQLASVEAGAVLADLVDGFGAPLGLPGGRAHDGTPVRRRHRRARGGAARRRRRPGGRGPALGSATSSWSTRPTRRAMAAFRATVTDGRARRTSRGGARATPRPRLDALDRHRLLCAHREGPYGVAGWNRQVERLVAERTGVTHYDEWYAGRPVLVTANDYGQRPLQRRHRRDRPVASTVGCASSCPAPTGSGVRDHPARRRADRARDDGAQVAGLAGPRGERRDAPRRLATAHPRALLHRRHPSPGARSA